MAKRYLTAARAVVGESLPWNIFNEEGRLLLKAGELITSELQAHRLATQGLYFDESHGSADTGHAEREPPSVLRMFNLANKLMVETLPTLQESGDGEAKILPIAQLILDAVELSPEATMACILLSQDASPYVYRHCVDTAIVATLLGRVMHMPAEEQLAMVAAALTQNIGMLKYQDALNNKRGALSDEELVVVRQHAVHGVNILKMAGVTNEYWLKCVLTHHECEDGSGYPNGLKSEELCLGAKLIAFADRYCARLADKRYAPRRMPNAALREVLLHHGEQPPTLMAAQFIKLLGLHPPGATVRLKNGEIGIVLKKGAAPNGAIVQITIAKTGMPANETLIRDTENPDYAIAEETQKEEAGTNLAMSRFWGELAAA